MVEYLYMFGSLREAFRLITAQLTKNCIVSLLQISDGPNL